MMWLIYIKILLGLSTWFEESSLRERNFLVDSHKRLFCWVIELILIGYGNWIYKLHSPYRNQAKFKWYFSGSFFHFLSLLLISCIACSLCDLLHNIMHLNPFCFTWSNWFLMWWKWQATKLIINSIGDERSGEYDWKR